MALISEKETSLHRRIHPLPTHSGQGQATTLLWLYSGVVVVGLLLMEAFGGIAYTTTVALLGASAFVVAYFTGDDAQRGEVFHHRFDGRDLIAILGIYALVVAFYRVAFAVISDDDLLLFLSFAAGLLIGVVGPVFYTVRTRNRSLASLGLSVANLPRVALLALTFAAVQFAITLWSYDLPGTQSWVTLLGMALMVGAFETVFFRGFVQGRLQASFGAAPAVFGTALLYGIYHVGYGMGFAEIAFLSGLGIVYAVAYLTVGNALVLWPLLTPLGNLYAQLESGELIDRLPWTALLGFADVMGLFALTLWWAHRYERKHRSGPDRLHRGVHMATPVIPSRR